MRLYLDDNLTDRRVVAHLQRLGHSVLVPAEVGHPGALDATHLAYAIRHDTVLLTQDYQDFTALHDLILAAGGRHPGILLLYTENDPTRDMTPRNIAVAITKLETAAVSLTSCRMPLRATGVRLMRTCSSSIPSLPPGGSTMM